MARGGVKAGPARKRKRSPAATVAGPAERPLKIGEAAKVIGVEPYVLRFWETQFPFLKPKHSRSRHRSYSPADLETLKVIKRLLHTEGYTIVGARKFIREKGIDQIRGESIPAPKVDDSPMESMSAPPMPANGEHHRTLCEIREDLRSLHRLLCESR
jgi:DNA-binding transcriptional MerR regulator